MKTNKEPYHYLQKKVSSIVEELANSMNEDLEKFKNTCKEAYEVEEKILQSRNNYARVNAEIEKVAKRQKEIWTVLEYFEKEIDKIHQQVQESKAKTAEGISYASVSTGIANEFNALVSTIDTEVPNSINLLINENMNLINYAEALLEKAAEKGSA